ncbi:MAG: hypothetical protein ABFD76_06860 [Smithella sp.]
MKTNFEIIEGKDYQGDKCYRVNYIEYDTLYTMPEPHYTKKAALEKMSELKKENQISEAAATLGRKGGRITSERKAASSRENGKKGGRPKGMKVLIKNQFHNTEKVFSIKSEYFGNDPDFDALTALDYQIYSGGDDIEYARKKQAEIKKALCGQSDCRCGCKIIKIVE